MDRIDSGGKELVQFGTANLKGTSERFSQALVGPLFNLAKLQKQPDPVEESLDSLFPFVTLIEFAEPGSRLFQLAQSLIDLLPHLA